MKGTLTNVSKAYFSSRAPGFSSSRRPPKVILRQGKSISEIQEYYNSDNQHLSEGLVECPQCKAKYGLEFEDETVNVYRMTFPGNVYNSSRRVETQKLTDTTPLPRENYFKFFIYLLKLSTSLKEQKRAARSTPILRESIGNQVLYILEEDASEPKESTEKTNAILALKLFEDFKVAQGRLGNPKEKGGEIWKEFLKKLHRVDIDPHSLAMRWLLLYTGAWWQFIHARWKATGKRVK